MSSSEDGAEEQPAESKYAEAAAKRRRAYSDVLRAGAESTIRAAKRVKDYPDELEAVLLINQVPAGLLDQFKALADFDPTALTLEQMTQAVQTANAVEPYIIPEQQERGMSE